MRLVRHESSQLVLVVLVALVTRLAFVGVWQCIHLHNPQQFEFPDSEGYWDLGHRLAVGEPYEFGSPDRRVFRAPGYPLLLAVMFRVVGVEATPTAARILGAMIGALTVGVVFWLASGMFGGRVAWIAACITALYPESIFISGVPLSDGPFCLWMMLQLTLWWMAGSPDRAATPCGRQLLLAAFAGVACGIATLTRPSWLLFTPLVVIAWAVFCRDLRRVWPLGLAMIIGLVATMMPWWIRNWHVTGRFVPTTLTVGVSLYDGLNPDADGSSDTRFADRFEQQLRAADASSPPAATDPPFEYRLDHLMRGEAISWAVAHPLRVLQLAATKFARMWNFWPNEPAFRQAWMRLVVFATYTPVMLLACIGGWHIRQRRFELLLLVSPAVYLGLLHVIFIGSLRYRQPAMLTLAILAAVAADAVWARFAGHPIDPRSPSLSC